ncbi:MAG: hypothetical protein EG822_07305 [Deltaproteobacteria bacterium]|nr:hypothetical protein [Deltaproteobacteria bacterium]
MTVNFYTLTLVLVFLVTIDFRIEISQVLPSATILEISAYIIALLYIGQYGLRTDTNTIKDKIISFITNNKIACLYFFWTALAAVVGLIKSTETLQVFKDLLPSLILLFFVVTFIYNEKRIRALITVYVVGIFFNIILATLQIMTNKYYIGGISEITFLKTNPQGDIVDHIAMGFYAHPNGFAMFLIPGIILIVSMLRFRYVKTVRFKIVLLMILPIIFFVLLHTYAKGAMAWTILGLLLLICAPYIGQKWRFTTGILINIGGIIFLSLYSIWLFFTSNSAFGTMLGRMSLWIAGVVTLSRDYFIMAFGNGYVNMRHTSLDLFNIDYDNAHNGFINQALNYGLPALLLFLVLIIATFKELASSPDGPHGKMKAIKIFCFSALVAVFGNYFFEPAELGVSAQAHIFLLLAIASIISKPFKQLTHD